MPRSRQETHRSPALSRSARPAVVLAAGPHADPNKDTVLELQLLLEDLGYRVDAVVRQRRPPPGSLVGPGKLEELEALLQERRAAGLSPSVVITADRVPSGQLAYLEKALDAPVLDRTDVILQVFEARARTKLARLEIELARLVHQLPRVRDHRDLGAKEGGGGRGGRGHSNVELAKQRTRVRTAELRREIDAERARRRRTTTRRHAVPTVALVGYTNAGKSAWMQALTGSTVHVEDKLFATLDTTVRALVFGPHQRVLVADTVGFLEDLPHALVESFRSTLDEAVVADLLLLVADASHPHLREHLAVTHAALAESSGEDRPRLLLLNKADRLTPEERCALQREFPDALIVSSRDEHDVREVGARIRAFAAEALTRSP